MTGYEPVCQAICEAMIRLLDGHLIRSDGKLTVKSLPTSPGSNDGS